MVFQVRIREFHKEDPMSLVVIAFLFLAAIYGGYLSGAAGTVLGLLGLLLLLHPGRIVLVVKKKTAK